jgi:putative drug exporter of the RND superfamily
MLDGIARLVVHRRRLVLVVAALAFALAGAFGAGVADRLTLGGFEDPSAESARAARILEDRFGGQPTIVVLVEPPAGTGVDDPGVAALGRRLTEELAAEEGVSAAVSYWTLPDASPLKARDGDSALILGVIPGDDDRLTEVAQEVVPRWDRTVDGVRVRPGGVAAVYDEVGRLIERDAVRAEMVVLPLTLVLLVLIFGSVVAASLPLLVGVLSILGTFFVLRVVASVTDVSIYSLNLTTAMGLGLAIDYSLFVVSRFREELARGRATADAVRTTVRTAGRTVAFSALTVAASLGALLVFPLAFLRSFAYAGIAVVMIAGVGAVVVLPALLAVLGPRVDRLSVRRSTRAAATGEHGFWHRTATFVMRRPWPVAVGVTALLLLLGTPFLGIRLGFPDDRVLPKDAVSRQVSDVIRADYDSNESSATTVVAPSTGAPAQRAEAIADYARRLSQVEGVARVDALTGSYAGGTQVRPATLLSQRFAGVDSTYLSVVPAVEPVSLRGERLVRDLRAVDAPFEVLVGGISADLVDTKASLLGDLPLAGLLIALATFVVLFLSFGSLLVPVKAVLLNLLSLTATFGAMVWIFQEGHLSGLLDFTATGTLTSTMPILMFCIAFGLSMDYEVFLLSRIKEEHDRTGDNTRSVAVGLERTGRIVTAAAALISVTFATFAATGSISFMKLFGVGLTMAVVMDATLIRGLLVPAFMKLAGEANWWAPRWMRAVYDRVGFDHGTDDGTEATPADTARRRDPTPAPADATG